MKEPKFLTGVFRHQIRFVFPDNHAKPTDFVETRLVRDIDFFPERAEGFVYETVLEFEIETPASHVRRNTSEVLYTSGIYLIVRDARELDENFVEVPVNEQFRPRLRVITQSQFNIEEQALAA